MSLSRASFLRALIGAPFAAKAVERIIANGVAAPAPVPVKPTTPEPRASAWDEERFYSFTGMPLNVSGRFWISG